MECELFLHSMAILMAKMENMSSWMDALSSAFTLNLGIESTRGVRQVDVSMEFGTRYTIPTVVQVILDR